MNTKPPTEPTVRSRWTHRDEQMLSDLTERKARLMKENREPVLHLARVLLPAGNLGQWMELTDALIANADGTRDALEPFDSGVRVAP